MKTMTTTERTDETLAIASDAAIEHRADDALAIRLAVFDGALAQFVERAQAQTDAYMAKHFPSNPRQLLSVDPNGRRYVRIWKQDVGSESRSVFCFVDKTNGDVLKAASWKAPAKHARGNVFSPERGADGVGPFGALYMR